MSDTAKSSRPLHLQTIGSLFAELIGGAGVSVGEDNSEFCLENKDSRAILNWYRLNQPKWAGYVMPPDVEAIVSAILLALPAVAIPDIVTPRPSRRLRLKKVVAHRFAGVHAYGTPDKPPPDFEFELRKHITLFEGWNAAGKTSLLNTIIWCLTGEVLRPQRQPESGQEEFSSSFTRSVDGNDQTTSHTLTPVTPLPNPAPVDTWVELTFVDQDDNPLSVRRTQSRTTKGKVSDLESGFEALGVDPIDESWFADKTLFLIRTNNLGFSVPPGCIAIGEGHSYEGKDNDLVIVRQRGHLLARRLLRPPRGDELTLAAQAPDPRESRQTLQFNASDVVLHRIVGILTEQPTPPHGKGEATELTSAVSLSHIKTAYRVRDESGIPLALPGQVVLGGDELIKTQLAAMEGTLIALSLDDGRSIFKRIGELVPGSGGRLRQFESIGGLGSSVVVSLVEPEEESDAPRFVCARLVIGVLYTV